MRKDTHKQGENNSSSNCDSDSYLPLSLLLSCLLFPFVPVRWLRTVTTKKWVEYTQEEEEEEAQVPQEEETQTAEMKSYLSYPHTVALTVSYSPFLFLLLKSWPKSKEKNKEKSSSSSSCCCFFWWIIRPLYKYIHLTLHSIQSLTSMPVLVEMTVAVFLLLH